MNRIELGESLITRVEKQKRSKYRYNIYINEEYAFSVHEDTMIKHRLFKGELIQKERMQQILQDEERHKAYSKALRTIGRRPHSIQEMRRKLKEQGFETEMIEETIEKLKRQNYINDQDFAKVLTENRIHFGRKGRNYVRQELQQRGVSRELIQGAMEQINPEEEYLSALAIAKKKWNLTSGPDLERRKKTLSFLMRRGFTGTVISKALQEVTNGFYNEEEGYTDFEDPSYD